MSVEPVRSFVDTNILVYAYDRSAGERHQKAADLLRKLWRQRTGCLSIQVLQEFVVTVTRKVEKPLSAPEAAQIVRHLGNWHVHSPNADDVLAAIQIQDRYQISFWDAMIIQSATRLECPVVWSEDLNEGQRYGSTRVANPF